MIKTLLHIYIAGLCLCLAVRANDPETIDELLPLYAAVSFLDHGDFDIPLVETYHPDFYAESPSGKFYPKFGPGQAVILSPLVAIGDPGEQTESAERGRKILNAALWFGPLAVAGLGAIAFVLWTTLGYPRPVSALSAILLMTTTEFLPYSRTIFGDLSCAVLGFGAFAALARSNSTSVARFAVAGILLGFSVLVRPVTGLFLAPFALYLALSWKRDGTNARDRAKQFFAALISFALVSAVLLVYNKHAFGSFFKTGYGSEMFLFDLPIHLGLPHLLFSFEKGLFVYCPTLILPLIFWRHFHCAHPEESFAAMAYAALHVIVYSSWYASQPGLELSYGQRFLLPAVPFLFLAMPECLARIKSRIASLPVAAILAFGAAVQFAGCLQNGKSYRAWAAQWETQPAAWFGYLSRAIDQPDTINLWWNHAGIVGAATAVLLIFITVFFSIRAIRQLDVKSTVR